MAYTKTLPILVLVFSLGLAACGGGGDEPPPDGADPADPDPGGSGSGDDPEQVFGIGGSVTGLTGTGLVIANNAGEELTLDADGAFTFDTELNDGDAYDVTVVTQPTAPDNVCTVEKGSGTVAGADVTDVEILCTGPFALTDSAPADDDQDVSRAIEPLLTFSADIDAATVDADAITLASDAGEVDVTFDVSGQQVSLTPDAALLPLTEYTLTVSTDIAGSGGERMLEPATVTFKTRDAAWQADFVISSHNVDIGEARIAFDRDGNALAVWSQGPFDRSEIWWNAFTAGVGWETAAPLEQSSANVYAGGARIGFDPDGNALAVWTLHDSTIGDNSVRSSRYVPGWTASELVSVGNLFEAVQPRPVLDEDGNALVVWVQGLGLHAALHASRHTGTGGWTSPEELDVAGSVDDPHMTIDPAGNAMAVWRRQESVNGMLEMLPYAARHTAAGGWGTPQAIGNRTAFYPKVAVDPSGHAVAVWHELDLALPLSDAYAVWGNRFTIDNGWTSAERIGSQGRQIDTDMPNVAVDPSGDAFAIWTRAGDVSVNRFE